MIDIIKILQRCKLFQGISKQEISVLSKEAIIQNYKKNDLILKEGEIGDCMYIIVSGAARVFTTDAHGYEIVLARLEKNNYFGEQALLTTRPIRRNASVLAITDITTIVLSHDMFQRCLQTDDQLRNLLEKHGRTQIITKLLKQLHTQAGQEEALSLLSQVKTYTAREVLFWQSDDPTCAYYLLSGKVEIRLYDENSVLETRSIVDPGHFFGELAIIENTTRAGTAVAVTESQVAIIDATTLRALYKNNNTLHSLLDASIRLYQVPIVGLVTQYQNDFFGFRAMSTTIKKNNGDIIVASRAINAEIYSICYSNKKIVSKENYESTKDYSREILLGEDNKLIGAISIGQWDDLIEISEQVNKKIIVTEDILKQFQASGKFNIVDADFINEDNICLCMQVKYSTVQNLILNGVHTVDEISRRTFAGTVCGGCRPRILDLLGLDAWTFVNITEVIEHNDAIHSYRLQPLKKPKLPFAPGQHIIIEGNINGRWVARTYTLTSTNADKNYYEITVKREELGLFSRWLFDNDKKQPTLRISDPQGTFTFNTETNTPIVCFMGGIGITPAIAFGREIIANQQQRLLHIDYSIRQFDNVAFGHELRDWSKQYPNITTYIRDTSQQGVINQNDITQVTSQYPEADFFICGPTPYQQALVKMLKADGIKANKIYLEVFTHAGGPRDLIDSPGSL